MRILHTSDWHLGRTLHGFSLREAQEQAVAHVVDLAISRGVDLVIVAGDVFDRAVPPVESLRLLNEALVRLDGAGITTIITSGCSIWRVETSLWSIDTVLGSMTNGATSIWSWLTCDSRSERSPSSPPRSASCCVRTLIDSA